MYVPKFCRVGITIDDMEKFEVEGASLLGLKLFYPAVDAHFTAFSVIFGEHGFLGIHPRMEVPFINGRLIEVAVDVSDATATHDTLVAAGYKPIVVNRLPTPDTNEYLFGRDFHGIPFMICTRGDNEAELRAEIPTFRELEEAPYPKVTSLALHVDSIAPVARDLERFFGMTFAEGNPRGLGTRALTGTHRLTLVEGASELASQFETPLAAVNIGYDDVEEARRRLEAAGFSVRHKTALRSGGHAYYFGKAFHGIPLCIHPSAADGEMIGQ